MTTLVLLPGLDGTGLLFKPLLQHLPASWRAVVVTYPPDAGAGYDELARFAAQAIPDGESVVLLGESFSGPIAIKLAAALGQRAQALVLSCTFASNPRPGLALLSGLVGRLPAPARAPAFLAVRVLLGSRSSRGVRQLLQQALALLPAAVLHARLRMVMAVDVRWELAALKTPVLYLQGSEDRVVPDEAGRNIKRLQPRTALHRLVGPHGLLQTEPKACVAVMTSFLEGRL